MTDQQLSAAIHGPRQATDGAPVALNRSDPCSGISSAKTSPAEGGGLASVTARAFIPDAILILGVMALLLAGLWHLADPDERPLLVEPNGAPGEP